MAALLTIVSESSVVEIGDEDEFNTFCKENSAAEVSYEPLFNARGGNSIPLKAYFYLQRIPYYCSGALSAPVIAFGEKLTRWFLHNQAWV